MTYATQTDLEERFGAREILELSDRENTGSTVVAVVARALTDADAEINGYLAARYALPLSSTPTVLVRLAADMARYYLYDDKVTDQVKDRYDAAVKLLKAISGGTANLGIDAGNDQAPTSGGVQITANERVFSRDTLSDYG